ncbi:VOC family protein [Halioxenophilus aromaticivorans]|uniref:VOC family protein n=1 Tax=Halioxenophilus aromaticivorans TaxID=1306992 RepID=A0AAV3U1K4_9ALTE
MNNQPLTTWFEIPTTDYPRAKAFYEAVFATKLHEETHQDLTMAIFPHTEPHSGGAVVKCPQSTPSDNGVVVYLYTMELDATLARIEANGGSIVLPKTEIPAGIIALFIDSEGNRVGLHSQG